MMTVSVSRLAAVGREAGGNNFRDPDRYSYVFRNLR
jgi:hypothetical protein